MCTPLIAGALVVGAGVYQAYNQVQEGNQENKYYQYLAGQSAQEGNAAIKRGEAQSTAIQNTASQNLKDVANRGAQVASSARVALAANGIDSSSVTAQDISISNFTQQQLDEAAIRYNADTRSWETNTQAQYEKYSADTQSDQYRYAGANAKSAGKRRAFSTLLSTAATTAFQGNQLGVFKKKK